MRASTERKNITHIQKLNEALGRSTNAQEQGNINTEKPSVHFIDENDEKLPEFNAEQIMCSQISDPIHDSDYLNALTNNSGIASPTPLTKSDLERQVDLLMSAPTDQNKVELCFY